MSAISGSSGLGSAMSSWIEANTVAMLRDGLHAPYTQMHIAFVLECDIVEPGMVSHACNLSTYKVEAEGPGV